MPAGAEVVDRSMNWWRTVRRKRIVRSTGNVGRVQETAAGVL